MAVALTCEWQIKTVPDILQTYRFTPSKQSALNFLRLIVAALITTGACTSAPAQTRLRLSTIKPGTEHTQLVPNGDFQFQGGLVAGTYPNPTDWSRIGDSFATSGA